MIPFFIVVPCI